MKLSVLSALRSSTNPFDLLLCPVRHDHANVTCEQSLHLCGGMFKKSFPNVLVPYNNIPPYKIVATTNPWQEIDDGTNKHINILLITQRELAILVICYEIYSDQISWLPEF